MEKKDLLRILYENPFERDLQSRIEEALKRYDSYRENMMEMINSLVKLKNEIQDPEDPENPRIKDYNTVSWALLDKVEEMRNYIDGVEGQIIELLEKYSRSVASKFLTANNLNGLVWDEAIDQAAKDMLRYFEVSNECNANFQEVKNKYTELVRNLCEEIRKFDPELERSVIVKWSFESNITVEGIEEENQELSRELRKKLWPPERTRYIM